MIIYLYQTFQCEQITGSIHCQSHSLIMMSNIQIQECDSAIEMIASKFH